jgi:hypothetical protein
LPERHCSLISRLIKALVVTTGYGGANENTELGNDLVTLINHFAISWERTGWGAIMPVWLEYDSVAFAVLVFGIVLVELLVLSI